MRPTFHATDGADDDGIVRREAVDGERGAAIGSRVEAVAVDAVVDLHHSAWRHADGLVEPGFDIPGNGDVAVDPRTDEAA